MNNDKKSNFINTSGLEKDFQKHLEIKDNSRIIFSGIFGTGKTYFLNDFFKQRKESYYLVKLNPVNYAVAQNEDIFEIIKYDILLHLLSDKPQIDKLHFSRNDYLLSYLSNNWDQVVIEILRLASNIATPITKDIAKSLSSLNRKVKKYASEIKNSGDFSYLKDFEESHANKLGSIYEFNQISQIISSLIDTYDDEPKNKETVLLIDDLDRVDPGHIFRLLNVFSAHVDFDNQNTNKFGFDKVIFVCDVNNIRNIFHAQYGASTDFSGYIDKFSTHKIFEFDILSEIREKVTEYLQNLKFGVNDNYLSKQLKNNRLFKRGLVTLISELILIGKINLRRLKLLEDHELNLWDRHKSLGRKFEYSFTIDPILVFIQVLELLMGSTNDLIDGLEKMDRRNHEFMITDDSSWFFIIEHLLYLYGFSATNSRNENGDLYSIEYTMNDQNKYIIKFRIFGNDREGRVSRISYVTNNASIEKLRSFDFTFFDFFIKSLKYYNLIKYTNN